MHITIYQSTMARLLSIACLASLASGFMPAMENSVRTATPSSLSSPSFRGEFGALCAGTDATFLEEVDLSEKYYPPKAKEIPKVLGGVKIGLRKLVVITGASSGLGLNCAATLAKTGRYFVVMAVRDVDKAKRGEELAMDIDNLQSLLFLCSLMLFVSCL